MKLGDIVLAQQEQKLQTNELILVSTLAQSKAGGRIIEGLELVVEAGEGGAVFEVDGG